MNANKTKTGERGESLAEEYLSRHGYRIIERNWHCRFGELDIIAEDDDQLVFVEVRTRHAATTESALGSISPSKISRLLKAVYMYLDSIPDGENKHWRIDVIGVALRHGISPIIDHVQDAIDW